MFPVKDYYNAFLSGAPSTVNYDFSTFQRFCLFCDHHGERRSPYSFRSPGRKAVLQDAGPTTGSIHARASATRLLGLHDDVQDV